MTARRETAAEKQERLATALRANLRRRKVQQQARERAQELQNAVAPPEDKNPQS